MVSMLAAIALSTGNKAKTHGKNGAVLIVERHYSRIQCCWSLHRVESNGQYDGHGYDGNFGKLRAALLEYGVSPEEAVWLPVEVPFSEEGAS
jgi:hypothetical protein